MDPLLNTTSFYPEPITQNQQAPPFPHAKLQMASDSGERRVTKLTGRPPEPEQLPCPRCNSVNTKFCYYNNYNLSQPRHFCKSCRRYWTRGGALRNVPVGGGTRKPASSNKRPRIATPTTDSNRNTFVSCSSDSDGSGQNQAPNRIVSNHSPGLDSGSLAVASDSSTAKSGCLDSWWSGQVADLGGGGSTLDGYGLVHGSGHGQAFWDWPMDPVGAEMGAETPGCDTWQIGGGSDVVLAEGDYFSLPDLAISTPATALK